jgi:hypothetical protein
VHNTVSILSWSLGAVPDCGNPTDHQVLHLKRSRMSISLLRSWGGPSGSTIGDNGLLGALRCDLCQPLQC